MNERKVEEIAVNSLTPYKNNARVHSPKQVEEIARSIRVYGFTSPVLADNKLAEKAGWDRELLAIEFQELMKIDMDFDLTLTGFETPEIDIILDAVEEGDKEDIFPEML